MIRILIFAVLFVASLAAIAAGLPNRSRQRSPLRIAGMLVGGALAGAILGIPFGWLFGPADGGPAVGAIAFGLVGFFTAICALVYRATNNPGWKPDAPSMRSMPLAVAIAIPLCALVAAMLGWMLPIEEESERAMIPIATALLGVMLGAAFGIVYEKGRAGLLAILGFVFLSVMAFLVIRWFEGP